MPRWGHFPSRICDPSQGRGGFVAICSSIALGVEVLAAPNFLKAGSRLFLSIFKDYSSHDYLCSTLNTLNYVPCRMVRKRPSATNRSSFDTWLSWMKHIQLPISSCPSQVCVAMLIFIPNNSPSFDRQVVFGFVFKRNIYQRVAFHCKGISSMRNGPWCFLCPTHWCYM